MMDNGNYAVPGYEGICAECFWPVSTGEGFRFREKGRLFHAKCVEAHPNGYYVKLERRRAQRAAAEAQKRCSGRITA